MKHKHLIATCKRCGGTQLKVFFTEDSIGGLCISCKLVIFQIFDFEYFKKATKKTVKTVKKEMKTAKCDLCGSSCGSSCSHKNKKKKKLPN